MGGFFYGRIILWEDFVGGFFCGRIILLEYFGGGLLWEDDFVERL